MRFLIKNSLIILKFYEFLINFNNLYKIIKLIFINIIIKILNLYFYYLIFYKINYENIKIIFYFMQYYNYYYKVNLLSLNY